MCKCSNRCTRDVPQKHGQYNKIWVNWKARQGDFSVRSAEQNSCPCCNGALHVIGSRRRIFINDQGDKIILIIRRLRCSNCDRIHHELPDILIPYKRYGSTSIESVLSEDTALTVAADESSIRHWRSWFQERYDYLQGCLLSIAIRNGQDTAEGLYSLPKSKLQKVWQYVGDAPGWLARLVRPIVNSNLWIHTRFAFLS